MKKEAWSGAIMSDRGRNKLKSNTNQTTGDSHKI